MSKVDSVLAVFAEEMNGNSKVEAEIKALEVRLAQLHAQVGAGLDVAAAKAFLDSVDSLWGGNATEAVLRMNLEARFGTPKKVAAPKAAASEGAAGKRKRSSPSEVEERRALVKSVMTQESMTINQICKDLSGVVNAEVTAKEVGPVLQKLIEVGEVVSEGERRGKKYSLVA